MASRCPHCDTWTSRPIPPLPDRRRWRLAIVTAAGLVLFGLSGAHITTPTRTVTRTVKVPVPSPSAVPAGDMTRADCARLVGKSFAAVVHRFGMPADQDLDLRFFDSLDYPIHGTSDKYCHVYFDGGDADKVVPSNYFVRNVSVDL